MRLCLIEIVCDCVCVCVCGDGRENFVSLICQAFEGLQLTEEACTNLANTLKLSYAQHLTFVPARALYCYTSKKKKSESTGLEF